MTTHKRQKPDFPCGLCAVYALLLAAFFLLAVPRAGYSVIATWKSRLFLIAGGGFVLLSGLYQVEERLISSARPARPKGPVRPGAPLFALLYLFFTAVSALLSDYPGILRGNERCEGVIMIALYVTAFLLLRRYYRPRKWHLAVFGAAVSLFCVLGLIQLTGTNPLGLYPEGYDFYDAGVYYSGEYWSTAGNADLCAALLSLSAGGFTAALVRQEGPYKWLLSIPLGLSVFSILELESEAGMVALLAGLMLLPPFIVTRREQLGNLLTACGVILFSAAASRAVLFFDGGVRFSVQKTALALGAAAVLLAVCGAAVGRWRGAPDLPPRTLRCGLAILSGAVIAAGLLAVYRYDGFPAGFLQQAHQLLHGRWDDSFGSGRLYIWRQVWERVKEHPVWGGGPDTLGYRGLEGFSRYSETLGRVVTTGIDAAHNEYLNILVNQGAPALASYLGLLLLSLVQWWKRPEEDSAAIGGGAALFYLIQAFFGISMPLTAPYLWMALAVINNTSKQERKEKL